MSQGEGWPVERAGRYLWHETRGLRSCREATELIARDAMSKPDIAQHGTGHRVARNAMQVRNSA
eukprot:1563977-Rhodomonas_salina.6